MRRLLVTGGAGFIGANTGNVVRASRIKLTAQDPWGESLSFDTEGFEARAVQHEMDHLTGTLFIDRLSVLSEKIVVARKELLGHRTTDRTSGLDTESRCRNRVVVKLDVRPPVRNGRQKVYKYTSNSVF